MCIHTHIYIYIYTSARVPVTAEMASERWQRSPSGWVELDVECWHTLASTSSSPPMALSRSTFGRLICLARACNVRRVCLGNRARRSRQRYSRLLDVGSKAPAAGMVVVECRLWLASASAVPPMAPSRSTDGRLIYLARILRAGMGCRPVWGGGVLCAPAGVTG